MMRLAALLVIAQAGSTVIVDPAVQSKRVTTTGAGAKQLLDVNATLAGATDGGSVSFTGVPRTVSSANNSGTCVSVTVASTTVLAANASRKAYGFKASEANTDRVYCKLGATATTSNVPFGAGSAWSQDTGAVYTGVVDCIAGSGTQSVCPYEFN